MEVITPSIVELPQPQPQLKPALVWSPHALMPAHARELVFMEFFPGETVEQYLRRTGYLQRMGHQPYVLTINGHRVPRALWSKCKPKPGMQIALYAIVQGGGGEDGESKNPIATIAMVIVVAIATYFFGPAGAAGLSGWQAAAAYSATVIVGSMVVNSMFPPPRPPKPKSEDDSPTYSIGGGSNQMRRHEPFPKFCGVHRCFPDFGAQPYSESEGNEAYGFYIFDFGYNDAELSDFQIGANPISNYTGVTMQISGPDGALTLFPGNVDSIVGAPLDHNDYIVRTSSPDTTALAVEIGGLMFRIIKNEIKIWDQQIEIQYRAVGAGSWTPLEYVSDTLPETDSGGGFIYGRARLPDPESNPLYYVHIPPTPGTGQINIVSASRRPIRKKYYWHVPKGQYEVRVRTTSVLNEPPNEGVTRELGWLQLRSYQPDTADYTGRLRVALKIKASSQIEGVIDQFSAVVRARTQVWDPFLPGFVQQHTSNPAWWVLDAARGTFVNTKRVYGAGFADSKIDIEGLKLFAEWCDAQGLTFNGVFDSQISVYELMSAIAIMGRGTLSWGTGKMGVVWDAPDLPVTGIFGMHNILPGTFEVEYNTQDLAEVIEGEFINPDLDWQTDIVRVNIPGATNFNRVRRLPLFGRTDKALAGQDVNLYAAQQVYRNRRYRWQSDWEAMPLSRGDVIELSHDLSSLDYSGRFVEGGNATTLKLPRKVPLFGSGSFIVIVRPDGEFSTFSVAAGAGETDSLTLVSPLEDGFVSFNPYGTPGRPPYDFRWLYGATATPGKKLKVDGFKPVSERVIEISCIDEVAAFYAAKDGTFEHTPTGPAFGSAPILESVTIGQEGVQAGLGYTVKAIIDWEVRGDYGFADVKVSFGVPPVTTAAQTVGMNIRGRSMELLVEDNVQINVEVTVYSSVGRHGKSSKMTVTKLLAFAASKIPFDVASFQLDGNTFRWAANEEVDVKGYQIRFHYGNNLSWGDAQPLHQGFLTGNAFRPPSIPPGIVTFMIKAVDAANLESETPAYIIKDLGDSPIANVLATIDLEATNFGVNDTYVQFPGTAGNYVSTPDSAILDVVGDLDLRIKVAPDTWTPSLGCELIEKCNEAETQLSYILRLNTSGGIELYWSTDGVYASTGQSRNSGALGLTPGQLKWVRATLDVDNGAAGNTVTFYTSDDGVTWTPFGSPIITAGVTTVHAGTADLHVAGERSGVGGNFAGKIYYAEVRSGIAGTVVAEFNPLRVDLGALSFAADTGETWTVNQSGATPAYIRYAGLLKGADLIGTNLEALSSVSFYNVDPTVSMYAQSDGDPFYKQDLFSELVWITHEVVVSGPLVGSQAVLDFTILGVGLIIEYRNVGPNPIYSDDASPFYGLDAEPFYESPPDFAVYTGPFIVEDGAYQFRVTIGENMIQGVVDHFVLTIDAPDLEDRLDNVAIVAGGTRLPVTADKFTVIKNVQLTIQNNGGTAETVEIHDKDISGPLIRCYNSAHVAVAGLVDAVVKGY